MPIISISSQLIEKTRNKIVQLFLVHNAISHFKGRKAEVRGRNSKPSRILISTIFQQPMYWSSALACFRYLSLTLPITQPAQRKIGKNGGCTVHPLSTILATPFLELLVPISPSSTPRVFKSGMCFVMIWGRILVYLEYWYLPSNR